MQREVVKISGIAVEFFTAGEGQPLLFLHDEFGLSPRNPILNLLAAHRRVVALSLPGFGQSDLPLWIDCVDDLAYIALGFLDRLQLDTVDVVGCSLGGWVAAELASKSPERVRRLVLAAPYGVKLGGTDRLEFPDLFAMSKAAIAERSFHDPRFADADVSALSDVEATAIVRNRESFALFAWEPYLHNPKLSHRLERAISPTLFVRGASDGIVSADYVSGYAALFPDASATEIAAAGHFPHLEQPDAFASRVFDFLDQN
jgi:pimeloyl-ACP methyl ester carboxylesterase